MKIKYYALSFLVLFILLCCKDQNKNKKVDYRFFSIEIPNDWRKIELIGIDSHVGGIVTNKNDSITFDYGRDTPDNNEVLGVSHINEKDKLDSLGFPVSEIFFSKYPKIDMNQGTFHNEYYYYDNIDNREVKIGVPKKIGAGITSIFFDSLTNRNDNLYLYGRDLDTLEQFKLLKAFRTIKIK
ncbi:hypothetical protein [Kordia sp.]|uniref:hypothetical protein n=1 Tax=Kordia sp. TaxID=1965332 RepID=UPI003D2D425B